MIVELIAALSAGVFHGAAAYINLVEHPARVSAGTMVALTEWRPSYKRATLMQAPLAVVAAVAGIAAGVMDGSAGWMVGAACMAAIIPFTLFVIFPTNEYLLSSAADSDLSSVAASLTIWNRLHLIRTILSGVAFVMFLVLLGAN